MGSSDSPASENPQQQANAVPVIDPDNTDIEQNKDIAAFSYLWIMSVVVYFLRRKSPFVRFHARQAMVLFTLSIVFFFVPVVSKLLELGILALMVLGFINAAQGQRKDIPVVGPLSRREISIRDAWKQIVGSTAALLKTVRSGKTPPVPSSPPPSPPPQPPTPPTPSSPPSSPSQ